MKLQVVPLKIVLIPWILLGLMQPFLAQAEEKLTGNNKIEELFIWKISDELKLSTKEEKSFADLFRDLNRKKSNLAHLQDETLTKLSVSTKEKDRTAGLSDYRKQILEYDKIQLREFDDMKKILGPERLSKYLSVKRDLTNKVKSLLTEKTEKKDSELPVPKVIEE